MSSWRPEDLAPSPRADAVGQRIVRAHELHGRVEPALETQPLAWTLAARLLDALLATPGAMCTVGDARELPGGQRGAVRLDVARPRRLFRDRVWLVLELGPGTVRVRGSASELTRAVLAAAFALETPVAETQSAPAPLERPAAPPPDAIDLLLARAQASTDPESDPLA